MDKREAYVSTMVDGGGNEVDMEDVPYSRTFSKSEYNRLGFMVFILDPKYSDLLATDATKPDVNVLTPAAFEQQTAWQKYVESQKA
jgi:hypothetical protein